MRHRLGMIVVALLWMLSACSSPAPLPTPTPIPSPTPRPETTWGLRSDLAEAPVFNPPALISDGTGFIAAAFSRLGEVWHLKLYQNDQPIETVITARNPYALTIYPDSQNGLFAVWLDYNAGVGSILYVAHLEDDGSSEFGALPVTETPAVRYSAAPLPDGRLWVVWSAVPIPESVMMVSRIDALGRPRTPERLIVNADFPALLRADGKTWLYWLTATNGALNRAELTESQTLAESTNLSDPIPTQNGDILTGLSVGADSTTAYVFWQIQREAQSQIWWTAGGQNTLWQAPRRLNIAFDSTQPAIQAGYNHGELTTAKLGDIPVTMILPSVGQSETLPTAAVWSDGIGVIYWRDGQPVAGQVINPPVHLIAPPAVAYDTERDLAVAWWEVLSDTAAGLRLTYSRR